MTLEEALKILSKRRYLAAEEARYYTEIAFSLEGYEKIRQQITACNAEIALGNASLEKYRESLILQRDEILRNAGLSYDMLFPRYTCSYCNDTGYTDGKKCRCLEALLNERTEEHFSDPDMDFENFRPEKEDVSSYRKCLSFALGKGKQNLLLTGKTGSGKTHMLISIYKTLKERGEEVLYLTAFSLNRKFIEITFSNNEEKRKKCWDNLLSVQYLLIDDLGTEQSYANVTLPCLYNLYNERSFTKNTATATNLSFKGLLDNYTDRIYSRLVDKNKTELANFSSYDHRIPKRK